MGESTTTATMPTARKVLCVVYGSIAVIAAVAVWSQVGPYSSSITGLFVTFWQDTKVNGAARFLTADALLLALAVSVLFVVEARKHQIRFVWAYLIGSIFLGISVMAPLFLLARELKLGASPMPQVKPVDVVLLVAFALMILGLVWYVAFA